MIRQRGVLWIHIVGWVGLLALALFNASLRELTYGKFIPEPRANQGSVFTGVLFFWAFAARLGRAWPLSSARQAFFVGAAWLALTVSFEFLFGRYGARRPWPVLIQEYNLLAGRLWTVLLAAVFLLPWLVFRKKKGAGGPTGESPGATIGRPPDAARGPTGIS